METTRNPINIGQTLLPCTTANTSNRRRNCNQLKIRWDLIKKPVTEMSDDQTMDHALQIYAGEHDAAYVKRLNDENDEKDKSATLNPTHVVNMDVKSMTVLQLFFFVKNSCLIFWPPIRTVLH